MSHQLGIRVFLANYKNCVAVFAPGLAFEKNSVLCYLQLKRYAIFVFIVT